MMLHAHPGIRVFAAAGCSLAAAAMAAPALAADLCGRPREAPDALLQRLTKDEKLGESFRNNAYVAVHDAARRTLWTFTVAGHPAHPSVICRRPVEEGGRMRLEMGVQCGVSEDQCERFVRAFANVSKKMLDEAAQKHKQR